MVASEKGMVERRTEAVGGVMGGGIGKKKCKRMTKRSSLQRLFMACRDVFKGLGTVPHPADVTKLCRILDNMRPEDVGLSRDIPFFKAKRAAEGIPKVSYATIHKDEKFSLCILFLPPRAVIPLHNHPGMTVFSKLLLGRMHIKSYDWVDPVSSDSSLLPPSKLRLARLKADSVFTAPCNTSVLYPTSGGNIHAFTAITPCAVLDVLGPPYSKKDGRDCSYYKESPYTSFSNEEAKTRKEEEEEGERYGWLEEVEMPEESEMNVTEYLGPPLIDTFC